MSTCVIVLEKKQSANELLNKLKQVQTPISSCNLVEPLNNKADFNFSSSETNESNFTNQVNFNNVKLLNPKLAKKDRQKTLALWLMPFGFIAGLSFSQMTGLETFQDIGFPSQLEKILGGLLGMISGWLGSFFSAGSISQENDDDLRALRKKSQQGFWLLILETPLEVELPWQVLQEINSKEIITIEN